MSKLPLDQIIKAVRSKFGDGSAARLGDDGAAKSQVTETIPTGIEVIDNFVIGVGGLPVGRLTEMYSEEGAGKTSIAMSCCAGVQAKGGLAIWAETEHALDRTRFSTFGADVDQVLLLQPETIEEVGQQLETALKALDGSGPNLVVWDSIAATPTKREIEEGLEGDARVGDRAMNMNRICRALGPLAVEKRAALLFINQVRENIGVMFGDKYTTPGGKAVKFHSSVRIQLLGGKAVKDDTEEHIAKIITVQASKNRLAPPWRKSRVQLSYSTGWDNLWTTINHAKDRKVLEDSKRYTQDNYTAALKALGWWKESPPQENG